MAKKKKKYVVRRKIKEIEKKKEKESSIEDKFYWSRVITGLISGILGAWPFQIVGWWMLLYLICFLFIFPFFLSFVVFRLPYKKDQWDWKKILKTGIGANFFIFLFASTLVHTIVIFPDWKDQLQNPADTNDFGLNNDIAYVADGKNGLLIVNVSNVNHRTLLSSYKIQGNAENIFISEDIAYLSNGTGIFLIDISDPTQPEELSNYNTSGKISEVFVKNNTVFIANGDQGLLILNMVDNNLENIQNFKIENSTIQGVFVENNTAYLTDKNHGLIILNITQPSSLQIIGEINLMGSPNAVEINGTMAFITALDQGVHIVNVSSPNDPILINTFNTTGNATDVIVNNNLVYISDGINGIVRFEIKDDFISTPINKTHQTLGIAKNIVLTDEYIFVSEGTKGLTAIYLHDFGNLEETTTSESTISFGWGWIGFSLLSIGLVSILSKKKIIKKK